MAFNIYKKEYELEDMTGAKHKLTLLPLTGKHLPKLYNLIKVSSESSDGSEFDFSEELVSNMHFLCLEMMKSSYPDEKEETLDIFVAQNLTKLLQPLIEVNVGADDRS